MIIDAALVLGVFVAQADLPIVDVAADNTTLTTSCIVRIADGVVIPDADGNGVIHVGADNIEIRFADGTVLRGAGAGVPGDQLTGYGIRIEGHSGVTITGADVHGFKGALFATKAGGLTIQNSRFAANFRQRLKSNPEREDSSDWLSPHQNDANEWLDRYGAAVYIEDSEKPTLVNVIVREGQNGIVLDRVTGANVYDCDASFLSGWGLALWRSSNNVVQRNAFDFCVRGYSDGVYNRGQDSAGILIFEQSSDNIFFENSATHGGDGVFGFAGLEAIGQSPAPTADFSYEKRGSNNNVFIDNDLSYAPAHGLEMTFSHGTMIMRNKFTENGVCGIWAGYSNGSTISENVFERNGAMAYGKERGGINIEHGSNNQILFGKHFSDRCAVHIWWDDDSQLAELPWVKLNSTGARNNTVTQTVIEIADTSKFLRLGNTEVIPAIEVRDVDGAPNVTPVNWDKNRVTIKNERGVESLMTSGATLSPGSREAIRTFKLPQFKKLGIARPVSARAALAGRDKIIMGEWGPWDHRSPLVRTLSRSATEHAIEVRGVGDPFEVKLLGDGIALNDTDAHGPTKVFRVIAREPGVRPYSLRMTGSGMDQTLTGTFVSASWEIFFFPWNDATDPRSNIDAWRASSAATGSVKTTVASLNYPFGGRGPGAFVPEAAAVGSERFGTIARTRLLLEPGTYRLTTTSDDGIRVMVDGKPVIENWTWHAPTVDTGEFTIDASRDVEIVVEHFEIDGAAHLELGIEFVSGGVAK